MMAGFWSGETLAARLPGLIETFDAGRLDCSAYTLAMGKEVYVSPSDETEDPQSVTIRQLSDGEGFTIPPGQFGFLLTEEVVEIPKDALGFISIKAKIKWRGLINVSGFHVDPGFKGRLIFSVYNAGPVPVHLRQGQQMFLLWLASLDQPTERGRQQPVQLHFPPDLIPGISGELQSIAGVNKKIREVDKELTKRVHDVEREQTYYRFIAIVALAIFAAIVTNWVREGGPGRLFAPSTLTQRAPASPDQANTPVPPDATVANTAVLETPAGDSAGANSSLPANAESNGAITSSNAGR